MGSSEVESHVLVDVGDAKNDEGGALDGYEREFKGLIEGATKNIVRAGEGSEDDLQNAKKKLSEAGDVLEAMEIEAGEMVNSKKIIEWINSLKTDLKRARDKVQGSERQLLFGEKAQNQDNLDEQTRLVDTTRKLEEGSQRIMESRRRVAETENVGANILQDLQNQRETILKARQGLGGVDDGLSQSDRVLRSMSRRAFVNKIAVYAIFAIIVLIVLMIIFHRIFGGKGS
eukprot:Plantae.Rhodophyta-Hildenbrandia_rubra.ctg1799.p2 GENE.Plantae.Rhodophyta-Hildenbrandia_rubra.ctg1799~~Plantae.Rhodophyta-Hildenbrandia_rubra.ctg1799.p2  ORF type:complete len:230 (+),score=63.27 Plantae.Rhodophyta-Hildenbrandia_rubra.ctg1799:32-721(+)